MNIGLGKSATPQANDIEPDQICERPLCERPGYDIGTHAAQPDNHRPLANPHELTHRDTTAEHDLHEGDRLWPHIQGWAGELGLTAPDAIARISQPPSDPNRQQEQASRQPGREAAD